MTTQKSPSRGILLAVLILAVAVLGGGWYVQKEVEKIVRVQLEESIRKIGGVPTVAGVSCNLLANTLEITGLKFTMPQPMQITYSVDRIMGRNLNRSLILAAVMGNLAEQKGVQPVIDTIEVDNYRSGEAQIPVEGNGTMSIDMLIPKQIITNVTANMDVFVPLFAKKDVSDVELMAALFEGGAYASRTVPQGTKGVIEGNELKGELTIKDMEERNFGASAVEYGAMRGMELKFAQKGKEVFSLTMDEMIMERMYISPELLRLSVAMQSDPSKANEEAILKAAFLGDRPFLGAMRLNKLNTKINDAPYSFAGFTYENSSTKPFAVSLNLEGLNMPINALPEGQMLAMVLNKAAMTVSFGFTGLFPREDPGALSKMALSITEDGLGTFKINTEGTLPANATLASFENPDVASKSFMASMLKLSFTDTGLVSTSMKMAEKMMGLNPAQALAFVESYQKAEVAKGKLTQANLDAVMSFLRQPGTMTMTVTPKAPMPLTQLLESLDPADETAVLEVTKGEKTVEEQVKAIK